MLCISLSGAASVELSPFQYNVDTDFLQSLAYLVQEHQHILTPILQLNHLSHSGASAFVDLVAEFNRKIHQLWTISLFSPLHFFSVAVNRGLDELMLAFIALYPLLEASVAIAEGRREQFGRRLASFKGWYLAHTHEEIEVHDDNSVASPESPVRVLSELDSYSFVRAGLWWAVLARDRWICCACGRTPKDGVTLEVNHIIPRSKGGKDELANLQTLCKKCNVGKSDKDSTDLRERALQGGAAPPNPA